MRVIHHRLLPSSSLQSASNTALAMAKLSQTPTYDWLSTCLATSHAHLASITAAHTPEKPKRKLSGMSRTSTASASEGAASSLASAQSSAAVKASQEVCNLLWALAKMGVQPSQAWMEAAEGAGMVLLPHMNNQNVVNMLYGLARMRHAAGEPLLAAALDRVLSSPEHEVRFWMLIVVNVPCTPCCYITHVHAMVANWCGCGD